MRNFNYLLLITSLLTFSCKHETLDDTDVIPSSIVYNVDTLSIVQGNSSVINLNSIEGTTPITYQVISSPASSEITIDTDGNIQVSDQLAAGTYDVTVTASNDGGSTTFTDVVVIEVTASAVLPSGLTYESDTLLVYQTGAESINVTGISGTAGFTYAFTTAPSDAEISINSVDGTILVSASASLGDHDISVAVTNSAGTTDFSDILHIKVLPDVVRFTTDVQSIFQNNCASCHTGGGQINFTVYSNAQANINNILDRVQRTPGQTGFMPMGSSSQISSGDLATLQQWLSDGLVE